MSSLWRVWPEGRAVLRLREWRGCRKRAAMRAKQAHGTGAVIQVGDIVLVTATGQIAQ